MTEDFTTRLRLELRGAALREEQRGGFARAATAARTRPTLAFGSLAAAATAALILLAGLWMVGSTGTETAAPPAAAPRVVANAAVAGALGFGARPGFGSVWMSESSLGQVLRVDPRTRRVIARIPTGAEMSLDVGHGSVWAARVHNNDGPLLRIDPRTNKVVARIPLRTPGGGLFQGGFVVAAPSRVWVLGGTGAIGIDPVTNRVVSEIALGGSFQINDAHIQGGALWITRGDRSITRFDAVTGRRVGRIPWRAKGFLFPYADKLVSVGSHAVALVDPASGRALWRTPIRADFNDATIAGGRLLVEGSGGSGRDRMWEIDPRTGRVLGTLTMPGFSILRTLTVGRDVWTITAGGRVIVVSP